MAMEGNDGRCEENTTTRWCVVVERRHIEGFHEAKQPKETKMRHVGGHGRSRMTNRALKKINL